MEQLSQHSQRWGMHGFALHSQLCLQRAAVWAAQWHRPRLRYPPLHTWFSTVLYSKSRAGTLQKEKKHDLRPKAGYLEDSFNLFLTVISSDFDVQNGHISEAVFCSTWTLLQHHGTKSAPLGTHTPSNSSSPQLRPFICWIQHYLALRHKPLQST